MNLELVGALNELERERGISKEILLEAIEAAIVSAYKRNDDAAESVRVEISEKSGQIQVFARKEVVEEVLDPANEISLEEARAIDPKYQLEDIVEVEVTPRNFGRIAAQTAKQVVIQRIREAERALVYEEYSNREGDVVTGIVQRSDYRNVLVDLGKVEAILPPSEQMPKENYTHGMRIKTYVSEVRQTTKGPQVIVSRTHPGLLKRLFELEVPEIHDGVVEIRAVAREAGNRSKIAVSSNLPNVDPVGACVGPRGMRVQTIVQELKGEKIDIVEYSPEPSRFIASALSPARVLRVYTNDEEKTARAVVPDHQLSLAIGREGQNARLAARLTGWKIDIKSESQMAELALLESQRVRRPEPEEATEEEKAAAVALEPEVVEAPAPAAAEEIIPVEPVPEPAVAAVELDDVELEEFEAPVEAELVEEDATVELAVPEIPLEIDELDDAVEKVEVAAPKGKKSRAAKKAEIKDIIEDDVFDEDDEPLPSLFEGDDDIDIEVEGGVIVIESDDSRAAKRSEKAKKDDDKFILKDLSELARLLDAREQGEKK